jgi:hypothetical protein
MELLRRRLRIWRNRGLYVSSLVQLLDIAALKHTHTHTHTHSLRNVFSTSGPLPQFWFLLHYSYAKLCRTYREGTAVHIVMVTASSRGRNGRATTENAAGLGTRHTGSWDDFTVHILLSHSVRLQKTQGKVHEEMCEIRSKHNTIV